MKLTLFRVFHVLLLIGIVHFAYAEKTAHQAVEEATDDLVKGLMKVQGLYEKEPDRYFQAIEGMLAPIVDFNMIARGVMAKYYKQATESQRQKFSNTFKHSLVKFYGVAMASYNSEKIVVTPGKPHKDPVKAKKNTKVIVEIYGSTGDKYQLKYNMFLNKEGQWKVKNMYVEGISLRKQFHSQFASAMKKHSNNIDKVIANWKS